MLVFGFELFLSPAQGKRLRTAAFVRLVASALATIFGMMDRRSPVVADPFEPFNSDLTISRRPLGKRHDPTMVYRPSLPAPGVVRFMETTLPARILQTSHDLI